MSITRDPTARAHRPLRCALLTAAAEDWFIQLIRIVPGLEMHVPAAASLGLPWLPNPCRLEEGEAPDAVIFTSDWFKWLSVRHEDRVDDVFDRLHAGAAAVVGLDGYDLFALSMPPAAMARADMVLKAQGIYRDRELYNYRVGPFFPGANWTGKRDLRRTRFSDEDLRKLRLSLPCFAGADLHIRARIRALNEDRGLSFRVAAAALETAAHVVLPAIPLSRRGRPRVHCVGSLTHVQRLEMMEQLAELGYPGLRGVTGVQRFFHGAGLLREADGQPGAWEDSDLRVPPHDPPDGAGLPSRVTGDGGPLIADQPGMEAVKARIDAAGLALAPMGRLSFLTSMARSEIVIAPTGFGELTFRHGEALIAGRALICQDLRHAETMFPFCDGKNVVFCRPDFADLGERLSDLASDRALMEGIAHRGRSAWRAWTRDWRGLLADGVTAPLSEAAGTSLSALGP